MNRRVWIGRFLRGTGLVAAGALTLAGCGDSSGQPSPEMQKEAAEAERRSEEAANAELAKKKKGRR